MRIHDTDERERLYDHLTTATDQNTKSKALDDAARYYLRMRGDVAAYGRGKVATLLRAADEKGSLTAREIAEILDVRELPVDHTTTVTIGKKD